MSQKPLKDMTPEEEKAYWEANDPLLRGKPGKFMKFQRPPDGMSHFTLRIQGHDIDRLVELAKKQGMKPSELARKLILEGLERLEGQSSFESRVRALERDVQDLRRNIATKS